MTAVIIEHIERIEDLLFFSKAYTKGLVEVNVSKLARDLGKDRKTIRKYLRGEAPKKTRQKIKYLDSHRQFIIGVLNDKKRSFDYVDHLFRFLKRERGITCSRTTLNRYIRTDQELNDLFERKNTESFTERFETQPGQQAQFDMKEKLKLVQETGEVTTAYIPTMTLSWSRYNKRMLTLNTKTETLMAFLAKSFEEIGGVPRELVIDNLKQFVETPRSPGQDAILTAKFDTFCKDFGILVKPCMPYRPQTKGKTETQNKIVDQLKNYNGTYQGLMDMHEKLDIINREDNQGISQATKFPRDFLLEKEKGDLLPLPPIEIRQKYHLSLKDVHVSNESLISYKSNKYSVPKELIGLKVGLVVQNNELHIYYNNKIIVIHKITNHLLNIKKEHNLTYNRKQRQDNTTSTDTLLNEMRYIRYD